MLLTCREAIRLRLMQQLLDDGHVNDNDAAMDDCRGNDY
jgi:hypothetical protein